MKLISIICITCFIITSCKHNDKSSKKNKILSKTSITASYQLNLDLLPKKTFPFGLPSLDIKKFPVELAKNREDSLRNIYNFFLTNADNEWREANNDFENHNAKVIRIDRSAQISYLKFGHMDSIVDRRSPVDSFFLYKLPSLGPYKSYYRAKTSSSDQDITGTINVGDLVLVNQQTNEIKVVNILATYSNNNQLIFKWFLISKNGIINIFNATETDDESGYSDVTKVAEITIGNKGNLGYKKIAPVNYYGK